TTCQTIPNVLLDTGSYGLRLFSSVVTLNLVSKTAGAGTLTECVGYADGSSQWGPVKSADVVLGQRKAASVPIQIIDSTAAGLPTTCTNPDVSPQSVGFNGILGIGVFGEDCGAGCATIAANKLYYSCAGATCTSTMVPVANQVTNPVTMMTVDNNGVALQFPNVSAAGATALNGWLVLGIGTQTNNTPVGVNTFPADNKGYFQTSYNGKTYTSSFIDSGSNGLFFPGAAVVTTCATTSFASGFYCPASTTNLTAIQLGKDGSPATSVNFQIQNAEQALAVSNPNVVFNNIGGASPDLISGSFDWGLPFYFGRTIFHGFEKKSSSLGAGPYFAW
ncbi:MAG: DUF3443 family protein, partial [Bdellovibrionaceae bacterium]|nr:DUF3443 family protein [Pseudobdellovibrionaceae bacterium]